MKDNNDPHQGNLVLEHFKVWKDLTDSEKMWRERKEKEVNEHEETELGMVFQCMCCGEW
jgi:hypothetical protein